MLSIILAIFQHAFRFVTLRHSGDNLQNISNGLLAVIVFVDFCLHSIVTIGLLERPVISVMLTQAFVFVFVLKIVKFTRAFQSLLFIAGIGTFLLMISATAMLYLFGAGAPSVDDLSTTMMLINGYGALCMGVTVSRMKKKKEVVEK